MKGNEWTRACAAWLAVWLGTGGIAVAVGQNLAETGLEHSRAQWVAREWLVWDRVDEAARVSLFTAAQGEMRIEGGRIAGGQEIEIETASEGLPEELQRAFPHLKRRARARVDLTGERAKDILRGQVLAAAFDEDGGLIEATGVQVGGGLDDLYRYDGPLGVTFEEDQNGRRAPVLRVWAPTARQVRLLLFKSADENDPPNAFEMQDDEDSGVWKLQGQADWDRKYYLYEVTVFHPSSGKVEVSRVTDPYSVSLASNSRLSQVVDLRDADLQPDGWDQHSPPPLAGFEDVSIYELHLRDFSVRDPSVDAALKGTFAAFAEPDSHGVRHLRKLAGAGITHLHLLPVFDIATIPELRENQMRPLADLGGFPPDSERQQETIASLKDQDAYNWGYDPLHYSVPEGSYAADPDGPGRILEFRRMVQALHAAGLRLVMDVVYNHTHAAGLSDLSVLDRIVPGYYHRLDDDGNVATSTCCANTASERRMMERLMVDSVLAWARHYRVDGFRFDLMGHHLKSNMLKLRRTLDRLTLRADDVDGPKIFLYGEGWDFGEVAGNARGVNATQINMKGSGVATFNDRLRDAARGGTPFDFYQHQGFATGLHSDPNRVEQPEARERLLHTSDWIRVGLAGGLADISLTDHRGGTVSGEEIEYLGGAPAGYTASPLEQITYVAAHDNETLFDAIQAKAPRATPMEERVRMQTLANSLVALAQGVPFFHAGQDLLRSKSMDRDSFNSGDWFNLLDFTRQQNGWGRGLPLEEHNGGKWDIMRPLLGDAALRPGPQHIEAAHERFLEFLRIRYSSPLFRLSSAEDVRRRLRFHNTGPDQIPGLIVLSLNDAGSISDDGASTSGHVSSSGNPTSPVAPGRRDGSSGAASLPQLDSNYASIVVFFNGRDEAVSLSLESWAGRGVQLHPIQQESADLRLREASCEAETATFTVPPRTTAVFVEPR
ncbi:MAG TPA: pullulanase-type alpha-1,6-glucosidase [Acidobacteriota bacterium]|nr:pullulanase-type alpha-1,6-glucosidase [Acidobacteriota bacterium]